MKIFISHASKDNTIVKKVVDLLKHYNVKHFVDFDQIKFGNAVLKKINDELETSSIFLLIWSKNAKDSEWVDAEKTSAIEYDDKKLPKLVFRLDDTKLGIPFSKYKYENVNMQNIESETKNIIYELSEFLSQLKLFKEKVRYDYEHFTKDKEYNPVISDFKKFDGRKLYVSQDFKFLKEDLSGGDVVEFAIRHLKEKSGSLVIVGDYGNGKSGLCHYLMYEMCNDPSDDMIPIFIPFGEFKQHYSENKQTLLKEIATFLHETYKFNVDEKFLNQLLYSKKVRFVFDALDELSSKLDHHVAQINLNNIIEITNKSPSIITSRHTYIAGGIPKDLIVHKMAIKINDFNAINTDEFLNLKFSKNKDKISDVKRKLYENKKLKEIVSKPLFLNIFCDEFDKIKKLKFVNQAILFRTLTVGWIQHDLSKPNQVLIREKFERIEINQRSSERLAIREFSTSRPVSTPDIEEMIKDEFKFEKSQIEKEISSYIRYARDSTFLSVEEKDSFSFLLKPFLEYFVASRIMREINEYVEKKQFQNLLLDITPEILEFIQSIIEADWLIKKQLSYDVKSLEKSPMKLKIDKLENIFKILEDHRQDSPKPKLTNAVKILHMMNQIPPNINLDNLNLEGLKAQNLNLNNASLQKTILNNSQLPDSNIVHSNLTEVELVNANLGNVNFTNSILNKAKLMNADLSRSNMNAVQLIGAHLEKADVKRANLCGVTLIDAHLEDTDFSEGNLVAADMTGSIMFKTKFISSNLTQADFNDSDMRESNLKNANLFDTSLVRTKNIPISKTVAKQRGAKI